MLRSRLGRTAALGAALAWLGACGSATEPPGNTKVTLMVTADVSNTSVAMVVVEVTAADIATPLVFNIPITDDGVSKKASGTVTVPAGSGRTFTMKAFDDGGVLTHTGSATIDVNGGTNVTVSIVLTPLTGDVPIDATLGSITVTVSPSSADLLVGGTQQLGATVTDSEGNTLSVTVEWATADPGVATVDATGLVTAQGKGSTTITATHDGAAGSATINVS